MAVDSAERHLQAQEEWWSFLLPWGMSLAAHLAVFAALFWLIGRSSAPDIEPSHILADLVDMAESEPPGPPDPIPLKGSPPQNAVQPKPPAPTPLNAMTTITPAPDTTDVLSEAQLAGVTRADDDIGGGDGGIGGGGCNMTRAVQHALQGDPLVRTAVESADRTGKAVMLWNGDWVRSGGQDGKGLSVVREAVMWVVAFAPEACRNRPMHGPVLLSLADGDTRFVVGMDDWRWSDLLGLQGAGRTSVRPGLD